jgi:hypothetical protein
LPARWPSGAAGSLAPATRWQRAFSPAFQRMQNLDVAYSEAELVLVAGSERTWS